MYLGPVGEAGAGLVRLGLRDPGDDD